MELNKRNIFIILIGVALLLIYFFVKQNTLQKDSYQSEIKGIVEGKRHIGRGEAYIQLKFKGSDRFDDLSVLYVGTDNQNDVVIGDSIYKPHNSYNYQVFRLNKNDHYEFYKILKYESQ
ncbi:hypothetical protein [Soonwooa purpurea]